MLPYARSPRNFSRMPSLKKPAPHGSERGFFHAVVSAAFRRYESFFCFILYYPKVTSRIIISTKPSEKAIVPQLAMR